MSDQENSDVKDHAAPRVGGTRLWVKVVLTLSLGVNLLIVGMIAGNFLRNTGADAHEHGGMLAEARIMRELGLGPFLGAFPADHRRDLARSLRDHVGTPQGMRENLAQELGDMLAALRAEPYDPAALDRVLSQQKRRVADRADAAKSVILDAIQAMSPAERAKFADRMERSMRRALENAEHRERP